ncbi:sigma-54-dependent Fis family transcriptional regulator [Motiliproteus coralliicola]|uniref:Sigma-54-dependent Fis family transcriptional regulator n=1 Tax=Motiliproteus coralliicola TaxID=2283196 RepID=A0A369W8U0_9GAMM|nr:sigma-54 dependent transcriptional regulator [Motiliproteus coralliicola]RDE18067.1 sigma-54-dependent Fis family transcriptional regulator [Motiliproteus coralliicola]
MVTETSESRPTAPVRVMLIDDEEPIRRATRQWLNLAGIEVQDFSRAREALAVIEADAELVVVSDIKMPEMDGLAFAKACRAIDPDLPVLLVTAHGDVGMAVEAMRDGVYDFIEKPVEPDLLLDRIQRAWEKRQLVLENRKLRRILEQGPTLERRMIGNSAAMVALRKQVLQLGETPVDVVINGATGTGKELVARCLHDFSVRRQQPFVAVNCGAIPENLFESELFGHEKGAFTGATGQRIGKIEYAQGGTLFLDEIESMPLNFQIKLLRVLQERKLERVGSNREIELDLWVIAATKVDLADASARGDFREDLYYRFNVAELQLPKLAQRVEDIPSLFDFFGHKAALQYQRDYLEPESDDLAAMMDYGWPGNVRQLRNVAERYVLGMGSSRRVRSILGQSDSVATESSGQGLSERVQQFERQLIIQSLRKHQGSIQAVTEALQLPRRTLNNKMKQYQIVRKDYL